MAAIPKVVVEIVNAARTWARVHNHYQRIVDGKAPDDVREKAREQLLQAVNHLKSAVVAFERALEQYKKGGNKGGRRQIPWGEIARGALKVGSMINSAIEGAEGGQPGGAVKGVGGVVDAVDGEVVMPKESK